MDKEHNMSSQCIAVAKHIGAMLIFIINIFNALLLVINDKKSENIKHYHPVSLFL